MSKRNFRQREWIPRAFEAIREECLDSESLEFVLLSAKRNPALYDNFEAHFLTCEHCSRRVRGLAVFYGILEGELQQPVSPQVVTMARTLAESLE